jgi:hypothetical protein
MSATAQARDEERNEASSAPSRSHGGVLGLSDCPICGAPNGKHRAGCFNCGTQLQPSERVVDAPLERVVVGDANRPGRVLYVRR